MPDWLWPMLGGFGLGVIATLGLLAWLVVHLANKAMLEERRRHLAMLGLTGDEVKR